MFPYYGITSLTTVIFKYYLRVLTVMALKISVLDDLKVKNLERMISGELNPSSEKVLFDFSGSVLVIENNDDK